MLQSLGAAVALNSQLGRAASLSAAGVVNGFTGAIGNTPLIRIPSLSAQTGCNILGKAEFQNPGGSVKDRAAKYLIQDAEEKGLLKPGGTVVEGTAGNTGIGLAHVVQYSVATLQRDDTAAATTAHCIDSSEVTATTLWQSLHSSFKTCTHTLCAVCITFYCSRYHTAHTSSNWLYNCSNPDVCVLINVLSDCCHHRAKGYKCIIYIPNTQSSEKMSALRGLGCEVRPVPPAPYSDPMNYNHQAMRAAEGLENAVWANQFDNIANQQAHYESTGREHAMVLIACVTPATFIAPQHYIRPELYEQTGGKLDAWVSAVGTGGTLAGTSRYSKVCSSRVCDWSRWLRLMHRHMQLGVVSSATVISAITAATAATGCATGCSS
eukprot:17658-Heterococcus_DN1.PRE.1